MTNRDQLSSYLHIKRRGLILAALGAVVLHGNVARAQQSVELPEISVTAPSGFVPGQGPGSGPGSEIGYNVPSAGSLTGGAGAATNYMYTPPGGDGGGSGAPGVSGAGAGGQQFGANAPAQVRGAVVQASGNAPVVQSNGVPSMYAQMAALNGGPSIATIMANPNATLGQLMNGGGAPAAPAAGAPAPVTPTQAAAVTGAAYVPPPTSAAPTNMAYTPPAAPAGMAYEPAAAPAGAPVDPMDGMTPQQAASLGLSAKDWATYLAARARQGGGAGSAGAGPSASTNPLVAKSANPWAYKNTGAFASSPLGASGWGIDGVNRNFSVTSMGGASAAANGPYAFSNIPAGPQPFPVYPATLTETYGTADNFAWMLSQLGNSIRITPEGFVAYELKGNVSGTMPGTLDMSTENAMLNMRQIQRATDAMFANFSLPQGLNIQVLPPGSLPDPTDPDTLGLNLGRSSLTGQLDTVLLKNFGGDSTLYHEMAHSVANQILKPNLDLFVQNYVNHQAALGNQALAYSNGRSYALVNWNEFFAEMSSVFFGTKDEAQFRGTVNSPAAMASQIPATYDLLKSVYGAPPGTAAAPNNGIPEIASEASPTDVAPGTKEISSSLSGGSNSL